MTPLPKATGPAGDDPTRIHVEARLERASLDERVVDLDLSVTSGECVVLIGPNGAGKSSALRLMLDLEQPTSGRVLLRGEPVRGIPARSRAQLLSWLPQRPDIDRELTVRELLGLARFHFHEPSRVTRSHVEQALEDADLTPLAERRLGQLSGGELQRALIATLIAQEAPLLLLDEPANHLDPSYQIDTYRRLAALHRSGRGLCLVTHDIRLAKLLGPADTIRVLGMKAGRAVIQTTLADPQLPRMLEELYGVPFLPLDVPGALAPELSPE